MKPALRTLSVVAALVLLAFGYVRMSENKGYALRKGSEAPAFRLASLAGGRGELAALRGRVVVLNFWATWCAPCVSEMPSLERLHRTLGPEGLAVVTVATDDDDADVRRFVTERGLTMPVLRDPGGGVASDSYHTTGYPETFVLDRSGIVLDHVVGPAEWDSPEWVARFRGLLGPRQAASAGAARQAAP